VRPLNEAQLSRETNQMHSNQYAEFRSRLEQKATELTDTLRDRKAIAVERMPDVFDEGALAAERETSALALQSGTNLLRQLRAALQRMRDGSYGLCIGCEKEISLKRLRAVPWAARCVHCQEMEDRAESGQRLSAAA
jgi:DnaK suppressor protein